MGRANLVELDQEILECTDHFSRLQSVKIPAVLTDKMC